MDPFEGWSNAHRSHIRYLRRDMEGDTPDSDVTCLRALADLIEASNGALALVSIQCGEDFIALVDDSSDARTPDEWGAITGVIVIDADGWNDPFDTRPFDAPITFLEWRRRAAMSTTAEERRGS